MFEYGSGFLVAAPLLYLLAWAGLYRFQRRLLFAPNGREVFPSAVGLPEAQRIRLTTEDGERLLAWLIPPPEGARLIVYFHGQGCGLAKMAHRYRTFADAGFGVLVLEYRGYAGSTGAPSEAGLSLDADAAYAEARRHVPANRIVLVGESLGSGVAVALAARRDVGAVVLDSPYTSIADVAAARFWMFPVRRLLHDVFPSDRHIGAIAAPLLIVHGAFDYVVPFRFGRRLFEQAPEPKTFLRVPWARHLALDRRMPETLGWIARQGAL